ncbi:hypothetical protein AB1Y20_018191 [Prymnesium parvum]|uniref:5'-nucleotidase n=1 Tax=Prymnesium parvum TaxID=97485 RepID=A0AB34JQY5_PRYPA
MMERLDQQLGALAQSVDKLAARAQAEVDARPARSSPALPIVAPRLSFALKHMDALPSGGQQPLAIFCEFEQFVCTQHTESVLLPRAVAGRDERRDALADLNLPLKEAVAKLEAAGVVLAPGFEDFAELCSIRQVRLYILSHGLKPVIRHFLRQAGLGHIEVLANYLGFKADGAWEVCFRDNSGAGHDKGETLQQVLHGSQLNARVVFVGAAGDDFSAVESGLVNTLYAPKGSPLSQRCETAGLRTRAFAGWEAMMNELQLT